MAKQDGAVEVEEPLEKRSEALEEENPKVIAEILVDIQGPKSTTKSIVKRAENSRSLISNCSRLP